MKRANETLDLPATGDTTTSNASQEDIVEKNINEVAPIAIAALVARILGTTVAKNAGSAVKKALSSVSTVAKPAAVAATAASGAPTTTISRNLPENIKIDEAKLSNSQLNTLKQKYSGLRGSEKNGIQMDKLAKIMKRYPESMLDQLAGLDIPMVSKVAKAMTEGGPGSGPQVDVKQKKKDKADTQRLLDRQKRLQSIGKRNR